jgi:divalent metal cation (Fe/Co/Zn/Cd) transporter
LQPLIRKAKRPTPIGSTGDPLLSELQRYVYWIALSLVPVTAAYIWGAVASGSLSVAALTLQAGISIFANIFTLISMRSIVHRNIYVFPYGTGKLEDFIGFLTGVLMLPIAAMIYISAAKSYMSGIHEVRFEYTQIGMIPGLVRDTALLIWSRRILRESKSPSPMVQSFYVDYKVTVTVTTAGVLSMLLALWLTKMHHAPLGTMIDLALATVLATYMVVNAAILIRNNFRALIDLPLPEGDQLEILNVLSGHYDSFDNIGIIYTRMCGSTRIVEIELYFKGNTPIEEIDGMEEELRTQFSTVFGDCNFRLIPLVDSSLPRPDRVR